MNTTDWDTAVRRKQKNKKTVGLQENEESLLDIMKPQNTHDEDLANTNADTFQARTEEIMLETILKSKDCPLLQNIINELSNTNPVKWNGKTGDDIFPDILTDGNILHKETTIKELQIISNEMRCCTGRLWITSNMNKSQMVNVVVKAFGGKLFVSEEKARKQKKNFNVDSLVQTCTKILKNPSYPIEHLQIPLGTLYQKENRDMWYRNATVNMNCKIPICTDNGKETNIEFFSYPERSLEMAELEFRTFDFTHILTNLHTQVLTRGFDYCKKEHFEHLSVNRPDILSLALVFDKIDQQNTFTAMRMFNYDVENYMRKNGFAETADFIQLVRNWHDTCNRRGLSADERVQHLFAMHAFLMKEVNFDSVPFQFTGRYI